MTTANGPRRQSSARWLVLSLPAASFVALFASLCEGQGTNLKVLRIGSTISGLSKIDPKKEEANLQTLKSFIKDETGLPNEIVRVSDWSELADKMAKGDVQLGAFEGFEFAWAQEKNPALKPLALAVNKYPFPVVYLLVNKTKGPKDFAGLAG